MRYLFAIRIEVAGYALILGLAGKQVDAPPVSPTQRAPRRTKVAAGGANVSASPSSPSNSNLSNGSIARGGRSAQSARLLNATATDGAADRAS